ncbi:hypothetical protein GALMADRAFT_254394 [Galerina marginata CBS 339.88]|uniref:Uncharacterized protein n=1 Tax=Galerina marginata (strain CBS 339.88) TaxID=685588 RepID=A0A067SJQ7_GALM3|nr:hypothetical protein GALMADRAFT_254394 [Galerina marginata CBS 339.88]
MRIQDLNRSRSMSRTTVVDSASLHRPQARRPEIELSRMPVLSIFTILRDSPHN